MWTQLPPEKGTPTPTQFLAHVYCLIIYAMLSDVNPTTCGQMAGWMKAPLGTEVDLGPGHTVLDGSQLRERGTAAPPPSFWPMCIVATVAHLSYCCALVFSFFISLFVWVRAAD